MTRHEKSKKLANLIVKIQNSDLDGSSIYEIFDFFFQKFPEGFNVTDEERNNTIKKIVKSMKKENRPAIN